MLVTHRDTFDFKRVRGVAWKEPRIASGVVDIESSESLLIVARALNPGNEGTEEGFDPRLRKKWVRTWWMAMRPNGHLVWINEAQMSHYYEVVRM